MSNLDLTADIIDVRDIIERFEELEDERENEALDAEGEAEIVVLQALLDDLKGNGGDEQWRGDWYPVTLIRDSYFTDYTEELVKDCYGMPADLPSFIEIDWAATAENCKVDYTTTEIDGETYYYR